MDLNVVFLAHMKLLPLFLTKKNLRITCLIVLSFGFYSCGTPPSGGVQSYPSTDARNTAEAAPVAGSAQTAWKGSIPKERPGLGTGWGNEVKSQIGYTSFNRASAKPVGISSIYYNDKEGIKAMTNSWSHTGKGMQTAANGLVEWGVKGRWGYLKNIHSGGKRFVQGSKGSSYSLVVKNRAHSRLEVVLSVDGLDVMDGKSASVRKRGYIIEPGKTLTIKGFRTSEEAVAAFKFSSVNQSYSNMSGKGTRNVGVIGLAVFTEKGVDPWKWSRNELRNRNNARPFAEAPPVRPR